MTEPSWREMAEDMIALRAKFESATKTAMRAALLVEPTELAAEWKRRYAEDAFVCAYIESHERQREHAVDDDARE